MRRKTAEEILQLAVFDKMNWPPRAEDILLSRLSTDLSRRQLCYASAASTRDLFGWIRVPLVTSSNCVAAWPILDVVTYPRHIAFLASFWNLEMSKEPALDAFCQLHDRTFLGSQRQSREVGESEQREVPQDVIRGPATTCVLFRASEGQFKVRRLFAITVVDSCSNNIVEYCILRALYMSSNSLSCDIFATLTQEIVTCPSCGLERLLFVCNLGFSEG